MFYAILEVFIQRAKNEDEKRSFIFFITIYLHNLSLQENRCDYTMHLGLYFSTISSYNNQVATVLKVV